VNAKFGINHNTTFCVDTGAPFSQISYEQAYEWRLPFDQLQVGMERLRVGGKEGKAYLLEGSEVVLHDTLGKLRHIKAGKIFVLGPDFRAASGQIPMPPLLGDDILRGFTLIVESESQGGNVIITDERVNYTFS
jgi:hypothetical protein